MRRIHGVGIDVADVGRFTRLVRTYGERFVTRWFSEPEIHECGVRTSEIGEYAARFAVKEATWKSLRLDGTKGPVPWRSITVLRPSGSETIHVLLAGTLGTAAECLSVTRIWAEVNVYKDIAVAVAVAECDVS